METKDLALSADQGSWDDWSGCEMVTSTAVSCPPSHALRRMSAGLRAGPWGRFLNSEVPAIKIVFAAAHKMIPKFVDGHAACWAYGSAAGLAEDG